MEKQEVYMRTITELLPSLRQYIKKEIKKCAG